MILDRPGFANPVADAQRCFRALLDAMSSPGRIAALGQMLDPPLPLGVASAALLLTLCDADTPVCLGDAAPAAQDWLAFHCGARMASRADADVCVDFRWTGAADLRPGTDEAPEASAMLLLHVAALGAGEAFKLRGPGVREPTILHVQGLPAAFLDDRARNHALFPRGIDLVLCAGSRFAALPRTTSMERP